MKEIENERVFYEGYIGSVEFSEADNCYFGKVQGLKKKLILYEGQTLEELEANFIQIIDDYLFDFQEEGKEPQILKL